MAATITRRLVSLNDAAEALAVSTRTVRRYIADGKIEAVRLGRKTLQIKVDSVERFIDARPGGELAMRAVRTGQMCRFLVPHMFPKREDPPEGPLTWVFLVGDTGFEVLRSGLPRLSRRRPDSR